MPPPRTAVLFTDKTGTLTEGRSSYERAIDVAGRPDQDVLHLGLLCNEAALSDGAVVGGNALDAALWEAPAARTLPLGQWQRVALQPFDHVRRCSSVLVDHAGEPRTMITKGRQSRCWNGASRCRRPHGTCCRWSSRRAAESWRWPPGLRPV